MNVIVNRTLVSALAFAALACGGPAAVGPARHHSGGARGHGPGGDDRGGARHRIPRRGRRLRGPECDDYFRKYYACIDSKVPEASRVYVRQSIDQTRAAWKQAAATPAGRAGLADGCRQASAAAKQAVAAYGCTW